MSCEKLRPHITAMLDGSLESDLKRLVDDHARECPACMRFMHEQAEMTDLLNAAIVELNPPDRIWARIEDRLPETVGKGTGIAAWFNFNDLFASVRMSSVRYAAAGCLLFLLASVVFVNYRIGLGDEARLLSEVESYSISVEGNPFYQFAAVDSGNPFRLERNTK